jgi:hypothetical protein
VLGTGKLDYVKVRELAQGWLEAQGGGEAASDGTEEDGD